MENYSAPSNQLFDFDTYDEDHIFVEWDAVVTERHARGEHTFAERLEASMANSPT